MMDNDEMTTSHGTGLCDSNTGTNNNQAVVSPENEAPDDKPTSFINPASKSETSKVSDEEANNTPTAAAKALIKSGNSNDRDISDLLRDSTQSIGHAAYGVLKILNIPYEVTKNEIMVLMGRDPNIIENHAAGCPIHIIMERSTSKTMDCYVEFKDRNAAKERFLELDWQKMDARYPKLGSRRVEIELSNQDELLRDMFPKAKSVVWENGRPHVVKNTDPYSTGYSGLFTNEEIIGLVRHAEAPARSPFSLECPQRTYECMISTLYKFPWFATGLYTISDRNVLFDAYISQMYCLVAKVEMTDTKGLDDNLLRDFMFAGMNCPGFGERQKYQLLAASGRIGAGILMNPLACSWPFDVVGINPGLPEINLQNYILLIHRGAKALEDGPLFQEHFEYHYPSLEDIGHDNPYYLGTTQYQFNHRSLNLDIATALELEMEFAKDLLAAGHEALQRQYTETQEAMVIERQRQLVADIQKLNVEEHETIRAETGSDIGEEHSDSTIQHPTRSSSIGSESNRSTPKARKPIDPSSKDFEPLRRLSEPRMETEGLGHGLSFEPSARRLTGPTPAIRMQAANESPTKTAMARLPPDHSIQEQGGE